MRDRSTERPISRNDRPVLAPERAMPSEKGMAQLRFSAQLLSLVLLSCASAFPQLAPPGTAPVAEKSEAPQDALGRTTPRGAVLGFLKAGQRQITKSPLSWRYSGNVAVYRHWL